MTCARMCTSLRVTYEDVSLPKWSRWCAKCGTNWRWKLQYM